MTAEVSITYRISSPSRSWRSYDIAIGQSDRETMDLCSHGPVVDGVARVKGRYTTKAEALLAAMHYLPPATIVEFADPMSGCVTHRVMSQRPQLGEHGRVIARSTKHGTWLGSGASGTTRTR